VFSTLRTNSARVAERPTVPVVSGSPDMWQSRWCSRIPRLSAGTFPKNASSVSSVDSAPSISSLRIAAAVKCLVIEPSETTVRGVLAARASRSAIP
jgi:hypothetical protein